MTIKDERNFQLCRIFYAKLNENVHDFYKSTNLKQNVNCRKSVCVCVCDITTLKTIIYLSFALSFRDSHMTQQKIFSVAHTNVTWAGLNRRVPQFISRGISFTEIHKY